LWYSKTGPVIREHFTGKPGSRYNSRVSTDLPDEDYGSGRDTRVISEAETINEPVLDCARGDFLIRYPRAQRKQGYCSAKL